MSVSFNSDLPRPTTTHEAPCMCAQMAESFCAFFEGDDRSEAARADLKANAHWACRSCKGTGIEVVPDEGDFLNFNNENARAILGALGLPMSDLWGSLPIADARRALLRAFNVNLEGYTRPDESVGNWHTGGLDEEGLEMRLGMFRDWLDRVSKAGATLISWG